MKKDQRSYMKRALELASKGFPWAFPNPMVGAVIVSNDGKIIGEGYHRKCGGPHAEVNAIASVEDTAMLKESTMYVTLEPCAHFGRTGPCAKLIIEKGIPEVVVGCRDLFEKVDGKGIEMLRDAGVRVKVGVLEEDCRRLNAVFFTAHTQRRPFVILKWAQTADGYMDSARLTSHDKALRISSTLTSAFMHRYRSTCQGILVGSNTVIADDPKLDTRMWPGNSPRPIVLDVRGRVGASSRIMHRSPLIIRDEMPIEELLALLYQEGFTSIMVEGGATTINGFLEAGAWDIARVETGGFAIGAGGSVGAPQMTNHEPAKTIRIGRNTVKYYIKNLLIDVKNL